MRKLFFLVVIIILVVIIVIVAHFAELERRGAHHLELGAALGAGDGFALIHLVFLKIHVGFAIGTKYHRCRLSLGIGSFRHALYLESPGAAVKFLKRPGANACPKSWWLNAGVLNDGAQMIVRKTAVCGLLMLAAFTMVAQQPRKSTSAKPRNPRKVETYAVTGTAAYGDFIKPEAVIAKALRNVSAEHIRQLDLKLVSFGTRHTMSSLSTLKLSEPNDGGIGSVGVYSRIFPPRGIDAARDWIRSEFERISKDCHDC